MRRTFFSDVARDADRLIAVVVLPTPPFWLAIVIILLMNFSDRESVLAGCNFAAMLAQKSVLSKGNLKNNI
jgi:hypothetical protein